MARKKPSLQASLQQVAAAAEAPAPPAPAVEKPTPTTRAEKKMLVCYVDKETHRALRVHGVENDITLQAMFEEAMADFLEKHELLFRHSQGVR